jgi:thiamine pyrophosphate-dependent acetolactate synthase large subunit-like protein
VARTVTAFSETVLHPDEVPELIAMAYDGFRSGRPRPVHLAFPTDLLELEVEPMQRFVTAATRPTPMPSSVHAAAELLRASTSPMVIAGGGAIDAGAELLHLAVTVDAPVVLTGNAKGLVPSSHPLCVGNALVVPAVQTALEAADCVLVVGTELSDADLYNGGRALQFSGSVVRIDIDPEQLDRRVEPDVRIVSDAAAAMRALVHELRTRSGGGAERTAALRDAVTAGTRADLVPWIEALEAAIPDDAIVAMDSTQLAYAAHVLLPAEHPRSWLAPYGLGTLGCALPMAIGAAIAAPDRPVFALAGDGGWLFTVAEMATAVDEGLNIVLVVWDNRGYAQIRESFDDADAPRMGVDVSSVDPVGIAAGFGWSTTTVHDPDALRAALSAAFAVGGPQFIRVIVPG